MMMKLNCLTILLLSLKAICTEGQVATIQLSERDYSVGEASPALPVLVTVRTIPSADLTLQIIPLTFEEYETLEPSLPADQRCDQSAEELREGVNPAESTDFNTTVLERTIPSGSPGGTDYSFEVSILPDNVLEPLEVFLVYLNASSPGGSVRVDQRCAVGRLVGSVSTNTEAIRLDPDVEEFVFPEPAGTVFLFNVVKIVETELDIIIDLDVRRGTGGDGQTFMVADNMNRLVIRANETSVAVSITIIDDNLAEDKLQPSLTVRARVDHTPISQFFTRTITILDDEIARIGFRGDEELSVLEGETVEACVTLFNIPILDYFRFGDRFPVTTVNGTAMAGEDYSPAVQGEFLPSVQEERCYTIQATDDQLFQEGPRRFQLTMGYSPGGLNNNLTAIHPSSVTIEIVDNDDFPLAPTISVTPNTDTNTLTIIWTSETTPTRPITGFVVVVETADDETPVVKNITINNSSATTTVVKEIEVEKAHVVMVCAVNTNRRNCSLPQPVQVVTITTTSTSTTTTTTTTVVNGTAMPISDPTGALPPGIIVVIIVVSVFACCICLLLFFFLLLCCCYCRADREKAYWPGRAEGRELRGKSSSSEYSEDAEYYEDDVSIEYKAPL